MISKWPIYRFDNSFPVDHSFPVEEKNMQLLVDGGKKVKTIRMDMNISKTEELHAATPVEEYYDLMRNERRFLERLTGASRIIPHHGSYTIPDNAIVINTSIADFYFFKNDPDMRTEIERLENEKAKLEKEIERVDGLLNNKGFISKAPLKVVEEERLKKEKYHDMHDKVVKMLRKHQKK